MAFCQSTRLMLGTKRDDILFDKEFWVVARLKNNVRVYNHFKTMRTHRSPHTHVITRFLVIELLQSTTSTTPFTLVHLSQNPSTYTISRNRTYFLHSRKDSFCVYI